MALVLVALVLAPAAAQAEPTTIAGYGQGAGKVNNPTGTAVDPNPASSSYRDLYVADRNNFRVDKFGPSGEFLLAWGFGVADGKSRELQVCGPPPAGPPPGRCFKGFNGAVASGAVAPGSLAVDPATGDVFAADSFKSRVSKYKPNGEFLLAFGGGVASGGAAGTGDLTAGSEVIEGATLTKKAFLVGQILAGPGIPAGDEITRVTSSGTLELSKPATETHTGAALSAPEDPGNVAANEEQAVSLDPAATSGNFKLRFAPPIGAAETTANIPYDATPGEVQSALAALAAIGSGNVIVGSSNPGGGPAAGGPYEVEFTGTRYADTNLAQLTIQAGSPNLDHSEASKVQTTRQGALAAEVCTTGCVRGGGSSSLPGVFTESDSLQGPSPGALSFDPSGDLWVLDGGRLQRFEPDGSVLPGDEVPLPADSQVRGLAIDPLSEDFYVLGPRGGNERQKVALPLGLEWYESSGEFTLGFEGETTAPIAAPGGPSEAGAEAIQAALEALPAIGKGNVAVESTAGGYYEVTFIHDLGGRDVPQLSATTLSATAPVTVTTPGQGSPGSVLRLDSSDGHLIETLDDEEGDIPTALLTDSAGDLYVGDAAVPYRFERYDSAGVLNSVFAAGQVLGIPGANGNALSLDESSGRLYSASSLSAADTYSPANKAQVAVQSFPLPEPGPLPEGLRAEHVLPSSATLEASLNPEGRLTHYRFQYLTRAEYEAHGFAQCGEAANPGCVQTPARTLPEGSPPPEAGYEAEALSAPIEALIPETEYRIRLIAENEAGEARPEAAFTTRPAVGIESQWASDLSAHDATLNARLDPLGAEGRWWVEYDSAPYQQGQPGHGTSLPLPHGSLPASSGEVPVAVPVGGLQAATTYHYRFVAEDEREVREGGETLVRTFTASGDDHRFTTQPAALGFSLPDGRAWEMVSPPDKHGGRIGPFDSATGGQLQAAADGEALAYLSFGSLEARPEGNRAIEQSSQLSRRGAGGTWSTRDLTAPHTAVTPVSIGKGLEYKLFGPNLASALMEPRDPTLLSPYATERTPYVRTDAEPPAYEPLVSGAPGYADVPPGTEFGTSPFGGPKASYGAVKAQAATPDLRHVVLSSEVPLAAGAVKGSLYEWSADLPPEARLRALSVLPAGEGGATVAADSGSGEGSAAEHAISADGSRVFWTENTGGGLGGGLYVRDTARGETARLDEVQGGFGTGEAKPRFLGADADGAVAYFTDTQNLTADANESGADLYRCAVVVEGGELGCELTDLTAHTVNPADPFEGADVQGLPAGISADGESLYFVARGVLDASANREGESAAPGQPNLYLWRAGQGIRFLATLSEEDRRDWGLLVASGSGGAVAFDLTAAASPSGRYLAFMSERPLSGYDNAVATSPEPCGEGHPEAICAQEVFRYDAATEALTCLSCDPSGARPSALRGGESYSQATDPQGLWATKEGTPALAATLPEATKISVAGNSLYRPRYVQDDGRVFFNAAGPLVGADSNGTWDVYEYEPDGLGSCSASAGGPATATLAGGCLSLLSSGTAEGESAFIDASDGGRDVFFYSPARLSVTDEDGVTDIYDAREGGEPAVLAPAAECQGEACQPPATAPQSQTPASATFRGPANPPGPSRCARSARSAHKLSRRARRARRHARLMAHNPAKRGAARRLHRKAARLAHRAQGMSKHAKRCRRANRRSN